MASASKAITSTWDPWFTRELTSVCRPSSLCQLFYHANNVLRFVSRLCAVLRRHGLHLSHRLYLYVSPFVIRGCGTYILHYNPPGIGAAYGTAKSGVGISAMSVLRPDLMMKCVVPVIMAGIIAIVSRSGGVLDHGWMLERRGTGAWCNTGSMIDGRVEQRTTEGNTCRWFFRRTAFTSVFTVSAGRAAQCQSLMEWISCFQSAASKYIPAFETTYDAWKWMLDRSTGIHHFYGSRHDRTDPVLYAALLILFSIVRSRRRRLDLR